MVASQSSNCMLGIYKEYFSSGRAFQSFHLDSYDTNLLTIISIKESKKMQSLNQKNLKQYISHLVLVIDEAKQMVADQLSCISVQRSWQCVEPTILVSLRAIQSLARSAKPLILVSSLKSGKIESVLVCNPAKSTTRSSRDSPFLSPTFAERLFTQPCGRLY